MNGAPLPLPLVLLIVFGAAKLLAEVFERLRLPGLVGEILAGAWIGPGVLAWIAPNDTLKALGDLGVMFLLFDTGLRVKASQLLRVGGIAMLVATLGVIATFLGGWGLMVAWGAPRTEAVFVGAALAATSVGITASVLSARGLLQEAASQVILAAAVIDDVLGLILLAVLSSVTRGQVNVLEISLTAVLAAGFTVVVAIWGTPAAKRIVPHFQSAARAEEAQFQISLVLLFALAGLAVYAGIAAIVGAFLAGLALSETADQRVRDLTRGVNELLVPFFLAGIGMRFDPGVFRSMPTAGLAFLMLGMVIATKLLGCGLGAASLGWKSAVKVGLGMVPRGEVTMVVVQMGLAMAVVTSEVYAVVVFIVALSALLTPLLLNIAFRDPVPEQTGYKPTG
jgi:Kef-type K+ transport system membrane component KefB